MYEVVSAEVMEGSPVPSAATPIPLSTEEFHRVRRRSWHHPTVRDDASCVHIPAAAVDGCGMVVPSDSSFVACGLSSLSSQDQDEDMMASHHRSDYYYSNNNNIGDQVHMNFSRLFV